MVHLIYIKWNKLRKINDMFHWNWKGKTSEGHAFVNKFWKKCTQTCICMKRKNHMQYFAAKELTFLSMTELWRIIMIICISILKKVRCNYEMDEIDRPEKFPKTVCYYSVPSKHSKFFSTSCILEVHHQTLPCKYNI